MLDVRLRHRALSVIARGMMSKNIPSIGLLIGAAESGRGIGEKRQAKGLGVCAAEKVPVAAEVGSLDVGGMTVERPVGG